jgi:hypothetical protein
MEGGGVLQLLKQDNKHFYTIQSTFDLVMTLPQETVQIAVPDSFATLYNS